MANRTRREFLDHIGRGMLVAGLGASLSTDLGFSTAFAEESTALPLGAHAELVRLMEGTAPDKLMPILVEKLRRGEVDLKALVSAGALANAEAFGGQDYVGFHTAMAMLPSLAMAELLPSERRPLPVLKVLFRNADQIQNLGGADHKTLQAIHAAEHAHEHVDVEIRDASRKGDMDQVEKLFAPLSHSTPEEMLNAIQPAVQDDINVHRFVFAYRTYGLAKLLGKDFAHTLLRQSVRCCVHHEQEHLRHKHPANAIRTVMPKLLDQYKLAGFTPGKRDPGDAAIDQLSLAIYNGPPERSADAVAGAIADGISLEAVGEAISLASNLLALRQGPDNWRTHGDSRGVHASDATNAWRAMARITEPRHAITGLIVAAYHSASHQPFQTKPYPTEEHRALIKTTDAKALLDEAADAIRHNDQGRAAAAIQVYGEQGHAPEAVFDRIIRFSISEDGRLHGEEFRNTRPAFRWRQLVSLARITASSYGYDRQDKPGVRAAGYEDTCRLLGVEA
jgi:hypothetical protein